MNLKSGFGKAGAGFCASPTWSLNNVSDFHQLCLAFWPKASRTIYHNMSPPPSTAVLVPPGLVPQSAITGEKFPHLSASSPPSTPPSHHPAPFCPGLLVSSLHFCVLHVWRDKGYRVPHRHLSRRYGANASPRYGY